MSRKLGFVLAASLVLAGCRARGEGSLALSDAWARPGGAGGTSAVYLTITNSGDEGDALIGVDCSAAAVCELHQTVVEGDMVHMQPQDRLEIPAGGELSLEPGGAHIMLMNLQSDLAPGDHVSLTLHFDKGGEIPLEVEVAAP